MHRTLWVGLALVSTISLFGIGDGAAQGRRDRNEPTERAEPSQRWETARGRRPASGDGTRRGFTRSEAIKAIGAGRAVIVEMKSSLGTLREGNRYVVRYDTGASSMVVSDLSALKLVQNSLPVTEIERGVLLWGAKFAWQPRTEEACLVRARDAESDGGERCDARAIGLAQPDALPGNADVIEIGARRLIEQLRLHLANPRAIVDRGRKCPSKPALVQTHLADRFLADALYINGGIQPFVTDVATRATLDELVERAVSHLLKTAPRTSRTTYMQCYGGIDPVTPFQVFRALDQFHRLSPRQDVADYVTTTWRALMSEGVIDEIGRQNTGDRLEIANILAAYLHMATFVERLGEKAFQPWTEKGLANLLAAQTKVPGEPCADKTGQYKQSVGGWAHSSKECSQNIGYHSFIVGGLMAYHEHLEAKNRCRGDRRVCGDILRSLDGALLWLTSLRQEGADGDKVALVDRARGTSNTAPAPGAGNTTGADAAFRVMAYRSRDQQADRSVFVRAMQEAIASRPAMLPISQYLRANSVSPIGQ